MMAVPVRVKVWPLVAGLTEVGATVRYLKACRAYRTAGGRVAYTTDPEWLVDMAVNRRGGWPDDPSEYRGSARPVNGCYPKKASGSRYGRLQHLAYRINTSRLIVREAELGEWRRLLLKRLPHRITKAGDG